MKQKLLKSTELFHAKIDPTLGFRYGSICDNLRNSSLLKDNALFDAIRDGSLLLSHQTNQIQKIRETKSIRRGWGCLGPVLYTTPIYKQGVNLRRDNFFNLVLSHHNKTDMTEIIIKLSNPKISEHLYGVNYLLSGALFFEIAQISYLKNTPEYNQIIKKVDDLTTKIHAEGILDDSLNNEQYVNMLGQFSKISELIAYTYYEALSQVVMLSSQGPDTVLLKSQGEFNAHCYYDIIKEYGGLKGRQFDASSFSPDYRELCDLLLKLNKNSKLVLDIESTIRYLIINFRNLLAKIFINDDVAKTHLSGWLLMSRLKPEDQAYLIDHFNHQVDDYRDSKNILLLVNAATLKPELGIPVNAKTTFYIAKEDDVLEKISCFSCLH